MNASSLSFQDIILRLQQYWGEQGCVIMQPYDSEVGAGTFHTATTLRSLGPAEWRTCYAQPCRRPADGRYGENPNRMQHYYQFQVLIKPSPVNAQELYRGSLAAIGWTPTTMTSVLSRTTGRARRWALGPWLGGLAQRHGGHAVHVLPAGGRYRGRPRARRDHLWPGAYRHVRSGVNSVYDLVWSYLPTARP